MDTLNCMKALISLLGVILAVAFMASPAHAQSHENDRYQKLADDLKTPGLAVVTFDATGVTDEHYVGVDSNSNPIGPDSLFIWGSISKSFTSALAMMLAEQGKIDLNAPLTRYYPEFQGTALGNNGATVTDLIHHTAGLPRELNPYPHNLQSVIDGVKDLPSVDPVGTHSYSNISYILLQQLIERATGESYSTLLETYVDPATGVTPLSRAATINSTVPGGYAPFFTGNLAVREPIQDYEIGEGNLAGTGRQLADYGAWLLRQHQAGQLPSTLPKVSTTDDYEYGAGLFYEQFDGTQLVYHGGAVPGFNSYMGFNQQTGKGVVVLYNVMGIRDQMNNNGIVTPALVFAEETLGVTPKQQSSNTHWGDVIVYTQTALIVLALLTIGRVIYTWVRRTPPARSTRRRVITIVAALVLGIGSVLTLVFGPVALLGFTLPLLYITAPDLMLQCWILAAEIAVLTGLIVIRQIAQGKTPSM